MRLRAPSSKAKRWNIIRASGSAALSTQQWTVNSEHTTFLQAVKNSALNSAIDRRSLALSALAQRAHRAHCTSLLQALMNTCSPLNVQRGRSHLDPTFYPSFQTFPATLPFKPNECLLASLSWTLIFSIASNKSSSKFACSLISSLTSGTCRDCRVPGSNLTRNVCLGSYR